MNEASRLAPGNGEDGVAAELRETLSRLLGARLTPAAREQAASGELPADLWAELAELGLLDALVPEEAGGFGIAPRDALTLLSVAGEYALPLPLADSMLAARLLALSGLDRPDGLLGLAPESDLSVDPSGRVSGRVWNVPWGRHAEAVVALAAMPGGPMLLALPRAGAAIETGQSIAGDPRDDLAYRDVPAAMAASPVDPLAFRALGAATRVLMMAGALGSVVTMSAGYAQDRKQFGRAIGKFQAVQQNLAVLAGQAAAASASGGLAAEAVGTGGALLVPRIAAAKARAGEAAGIGAGIAHQVHGAIGFTQEHRLHDFTRRLWAWRDEYGRETEWSARLGREMAATGPAGLWPAMTSL